MKTGIVIKSTGKWYKVRQEDGSEYNCGIKGRFRLAGIKSTNPVSVGDIVDFEYNDEGESGVITNIHDRRNFIVRRSPNLSKQSHIIAANLDQAFLITTINYPVTTTTFIDRFLSSAEAYQVPASIIFNKVDRYNQEDLKLLEEYKKIYESIGYPCYVISAKTGHDIDQIKNLLKDKTTLLAGHSGVGKSTLINTLNPNLHLKTAEISDYHLAGKHTTTFSEMHLLEFGGAIIDTPGIRGFGTFNLEKEEIHHFFPEIFQAAEECQFYNCIHTHEPGCAVKKAVESGKISLSRYKSYLNILSETEDPSKYR